MSAYARERPERRMFEPAWRRRSGRGHAVLRLVAWVAALLLAAAALGPFVAPRLWLGDMPSFFHPHLAALGLLATMAALVRRRILLALVFAAAVAVHAAVLLWPVAKPPPAGSGVPFTLVSFNVLFDNPNPARLIAWLRAEQPDVVVLEEADRPWRMALGAVDDLYPWRSDKITGRPHGVVILSRLPLVEVAWLRAAPRLAGVPYNTIAVRADVTVGGQRASLLAVHPPTPRSPAAWHGRNTYLGAVAAQVEELPEDRPVIVAGDFNTPAWSPWLTGLLKRTGLVDSAGTGLRAPTRIFQEFGLPRIMGVPIDHVLVGRGVGVQSFTTGPDLGSDHLPVIARLTLPERGG